MDIQETSEIAHTVPPAPTPPSPDKPIVEDPVKFMNDFEASDYFKTAYDKFFEGKKLAPDVTDQEKYNAFAENEVAKLALLDFAEKEERYHYDPSFFPKPVREALETYIAQTRDLIKMKRSGSRDEIITTDLLRSSYHDQAAYALKDAGLVGSYRLGKAFARLVLISRGLETFERSRISDLERMKMFLGAV